MTGLEYSLDIKELDLKGGLIVGDLLKYMENISESVPIAVPLLSFLLRELDGYDYGWFLECFDGNEEPPQSEEFWGTLAEISAFRSSHHCCGFSFCTKVITATFLCNVDGAGTDPAFKSISQA